MNQKFKKVSEILKNWINNPTISKYGTYYVVTVENDL